MKKLSHSLAVLLLLAGLTGCPKETPQATAAAQADQAASSVPATPPTVAKKNKTRTYQEILDQQEKDKKDLHKIVL